MRQWHSSEEPTRTVPCVLSSAAVIKHAHEEAFNGVSIACQGAVVENKSVWPCRIHTVSSQNLEDANIHTTWLIVVQMQDTAWTAAVILPVKVALSGSSRSVQSEHIFCICFAECHVTPTACPDMRSCTSLPICRALHALTSCMHQTACRIRMVNVAVSQQPSNYLIQDIL